MIPKKTTSQITQQSLRGLLQDTDITTTSRGSVARALCGSFARSLADMYDVLDDAVSNGFLTTASGFYLDLLGETFGLTRRLATAGRTLREDRNIRFFVRSGTLARRLRHPTNLNLGRIPAGTTITGGDLSYVVDEDYDFPASATETFVGAQSTGRGAAQKATAGRLVSHSLGVADVFVENVRDIETASDPETDREFRFRISQYVTSSAGANEAAVRLAVLSAPGVADMIRQPHHAGAGSFRVIVIPTTNRVPVESLARIRSAIQGTAAFGVFFEVEEPRYIPVSVSVRTVPVRGFSAVPPADRDAAELAILRYLGNIRPGESLVINQLRAAILNSSPRISDLVIQSLEINRAPRVLVNHPLKDDELLVPDEAVSNPILVI